MTSVPFGTLYSIPSRNGVSVPKGDRSSGVQMINMGELFKFRRIGDSEMARVPLGAEELARSLVTPGDLMFARRSLQLSGAGKCALVVDSSEPRTFESSIIRVRLDVDRACPAFYFYFFTSWHGRQVMKTIVEQAVVAGIRASDLRKLIVPMPSIAEQRGIAATLGALDDKIESNRRAISVIQQLSRASYVAWHDVITGLRRTTFGEFANVFGGATPKTAEPSYWNGGIAWVTPTDITALGAPYLFRTARTISQGGLGSTSATLHPPGTIFMTSRATIGAFAVAQLPAATNQGFIAVRPRMPEHRWFLFEEMRSRVPEMLDRANGSTFMELNRGNFKVMPLDVPSDGALHDLNAQLAPLHARAAQLGQENTRLADVRDALLPELLSGRIRVPEAHGAVEEAVE